MLPRLPSNNNLKSIYNPVEPPEIKSIHGVDNLKILKEYCDNAFFIHKGYYSNLYQELAKECMEKNEQIACLTEANNDLKADQNFKLGLISDLKSKLENEMVSTRSREESERLLALATKMKKDTQVELDKTKSLLENEKFAFAKFKETVLDNANELVANASKIKHLEASLAMEHREKLDLQFMVDSLKVDAIRLDRSKDSLILENKEILKKNHELADIVDNLNLEINTLQKKIKELLDANKEVTINYQIMKKNYDVKKLEAEEWAMESEEAKSACQLLLKQKKAQKEEIENLIRQKMVLEASLSATKQELALAIASNDELQQRLEDLQSEEERLRKQLKGMIRSKGSNFNLLKGSSGNLLSKGSSGNLLSKGSSGNLLSTNSSGNLLKNESSGSLLSKASNGNLLSEKSSGNLLSNDNIGKLSSKQSDGKQVGSSYVLLSNGAKSNLLQDSEISNDLTYLKAEVANVEAVELSPEEQQESEAYSTKMMQLRMDEAASELKSQFEKLRLEMQDELEFTKVILDEKILELSEAEIKISQLEEEQYSPRMQILQNLEANVKDKLLELALEDEKIEINFVCPRDLKMIDHATTLLPCNHTFCKSCVSDMTAENFGQLKCDVCNIKVGTTFPNYKLDMIKDQLAEKRVKMKTIIDW